MAFESTSSTPLFNRRAFFGTIFGILLIAGLLYLFRNQIAAKILQWRSSGTTVEVASVPSLPTITVVPATLVPSPSATVPPLVVTTAKPSTTAKPGSTATPVATKQPTTSHLPQSGPNDLFSVVGALGAISAVSGSVRYSYHKASLRKRLAKLDIL